MDTKLDIQELFFQLKNKKAAPKRGFDSGLCELGIHQENKIKLSAKCIKKELVKA